MSESTNLTSISGPSRRSLRILYADDMPELRHLLSLTLSRDGHTVETAANGSQALAKIQSSKHAYDLVIVDHNMPTMTGLELVNRLRALSYSGRIIVFTSETAPAVRAEYARLRVQHVLPKTGYPRSLRALVAAH